MTSRGHELHQLFSVIFQQSAASSSLHGPGLQQPQTLRRVVCCSCRARAVWAPLGGPVRLRTAVAVVVGVGLYNLSMTMVEAAVFLTQVIPSRAKYALLTAYNVVHYFLPVLLTLACYLSSIVAVRRNMRNRLVLTGGQDKAVGTKLMDEATRALLAVFLSNLVFVLPISICNILSLDSHFTTIIIMFVVFLTHLFVDPLVFVCFNRHHRRRVLQALKPCIGRPPTEEVAVTPE
ncbi:uncharacterized protein LOC126987464 [Eriocheir sinensis]|uniref:uncharacterized protein LOC126987464 n=1 Tax=Eriocheir sinensis TaxID=95602 RepID=UPI0021C7F239|nr:uncharacterized protein LOC126987464 [Eriocheir sinensis]